MICGLLANYLLGFDNDRISPILKSEFIFQSAPFPSCHASTIVETQSGTLFAAWFGGTAESAPDVAIYVSSLATEGWSMPKKVADGSVSNISSSFACYNPVLFQVTSGPLLLFYKVGRGPQTWWGMITESLDNGVSWRSPRRLPVGIYGPIKNKPIELPDGTILCGSSEESGGWRVHFESTKDNGQSWQRSEDVKAIGIGAIQPSILRLGPGHLKAIGRTQQEKLFAVDSFNDGKDWGEMRLLHVPNPNSGTDAINLRDGRFLLVYNNTIKGRTPLSIAISKDAEHWEHALDLETSPGEFSYPAVIQTRDGLVHITYTWQRKRIRHVVLDPAKIN